MKEFFLLIKYIIFYLIFVWWVIILAYYFLFSQRQTTGKNGSAHKILFLCIVVLNGGQVRSTVSVIVWRELTINLKISLLVYSLVIFLIDNKNYLCIDLNDKIFKEDMMEFSKEKNNSGSFIFCYMNFGSGRMAKYWQEWVHNISDGGST